MFVGQIYLDYLTTYIMEIVFWCPRRKTIL